MRRFWWCGGHQYFVCPTCRFVRVAPVPSNEVLEQYYATEYVVDQEGYRRNLQRHGLRDLELLGVMREPGCMLEVGCSWGSFLDAARTRGWRVAGIELSDSSANWARERLRLDVFRGDIEASPFAGAGIFDVVVAWHVIEHVQDPKRFLDLARKCLRPHGLLALRTPNVRSLPALVNGRTWQWAGAPAHLSLFSPRSLRLAVEQSGFLVRRVVTRRGDAYNPIFEIVRGSAVRTGIHRRVKHALGLPGADKSSVASNSDLSANGRRVRMLTQMSRLFDLGLLPFYPLELLSGFSGLGPELFLIAERRD